LGLARLLCGRFSARKQNCNKGFCKNITINQLSMLWPRLRIMRTAMADPRLRGAWEENTFRPTARRAWRRRFQPIGRGFARAGGQNVAWRSACSCLSESEGAACLS
jgi:hypothetical protein